MPLTKADVLHPEEDDFIVTNDLHSEILTYLRIVLRSRLGRQPGALVLSDHRVDWQFPGIRAHGPDIAVFFDSAPWDRMRGTYMMRDLGARPICVIEVTSPSTRATDLDEKVLHYTTVGIPLYVIVDLLELDGLPDIHLLAYQPSRDGPVQVMHNGANRVWIPGVDLWLAINGEQIICLDAKGNPIGDYDEITRGAAAEKQRADDAEEAALLEKQRADDAEEAALLEKQRADNAEKEALLEKQRADNAEREALLEKQRTDAEKQRADSAEKEALLEKQRTDAEKQRADHAAQEAQAANKRANDVVLRLQEMEAELRRVRGESA